MIKFKSKNNKTELVSYSEDTTLAGLADAYASYLSGRCPTDRRCRKCADCCSQPAVLGYDIPVLAGHLKCGVHEFAERCLLLPQVPGSKNIAAGIKDMALQLGISRKQAEILYEYNNSEPVRFKKKGDGSCMFLENNLCSIYGFRPYICRLYTCSMGDRLSVLEEMIACRGTWHAYSVLGLVSDYTAVVQNPFSSKISYGEVLLKDFEYSQDAAQDALFAFF